VALLAIDLNAAAGHRTSRYNMRPWARDTRLHPHLSDNALIGSLERLRSEAVEGAAECGRVEEAFHRTRHMRGHAPLSVCAAHEEFANASADGASQRTSAAHGGRRCRCYRSCLCR